MEVRRFIIGDEKDICEVIKKDILTENVYDYPIETINDLIKQQNEETIKKRAESFHCYTFLDNNKVVGVGMIGPYWDSLTESSFLRYLEIPNTKEKDWADLL